MKGKTMDRSGVRTGLVIFALAAGLSAAPAMAAGALVLNGKIASTDVRTLNGSAYVKLSDLAKALGMNITRRSDGNYELATAGGANQVEGLRQGKIGDVLFDGRWRFQVLSVEMPDSYTMKTAGDTPSSWPRDIIEFDTPTQVLRAKPGYKLVVVNCRMRNGQKTSQTFWLAELPGNNVNTAITDKNGQSYAPVGFDLRGGPNQSGQMLPGAKEEFPILFSVPKDAEVRDLIFTLKNNGEGEPHDVRVSLTGAAPAAAPAAAP
ncbi:MAG: DUF4352 domain-containing protein [Chloroflexi bacterium]|nr:DUF4352 domain-containing protein [Chloroflexota bacterium]